MLWRETFKLKTPYKLKLEFYGNEQRWADSFVTILELETLKKGLHGLKTSSPVTSISRMQPRSCDKSLHGNFQSPAQTARIVTKSCAHLWKQVNENEKLRAKRITNNNHKIKIPTTSIICISVNPKLNCKGSDSLATGRSSTL